MRAWSTVNQSRNPWKQQARPRAPPDRSRRTPLARGTPERDRAPPALNEAQARLRPLEAPRPGRAVTTKVARVFFALPRLLGARLGCRAVSRGLRLRAVARGIEQAPCPHTLRHGVRRRAMVRSPSAGRLQGGPGRFAPWAQGVSWRRASSRALGTGKRVAVVALDAPHPPRTAAAPGRPQVRGRAGSGAASWTGASLAEVRRRLRAVRGRPAASRTAGARDRHHARGLWEEQGLARPSLDALAPAGAPRRTRRSPAPPPCATGVSACGRVSGQRTHPMLACRAPPTGHPNARVLPGPRLVAWADRVRQLAPAGGAPAGATLAQWRACRAPLPACHALLRQWRADAVARLDGQQRRKTQGRSPDTGAPGAPRRATLPSGAVRRACTSALPSPLQTATARGRDPGGRPLRAAPIAARFGFATQPGLGERKEAGRRALRLPALCGVPTRQEARQGLDVSVAEHQAITAPGTALTQQRRAGLPTPDALERVGMEQASLHVARIPGAKNRSNDHEIVNLSNGYQKASGPEMPRQDGDYRPESAVSYGTEERVVTS